MKRELLHAEKHLQNSKFGTNDNTTKFLIKIEKNLNFRLDLKLKQSSQWAFNGFNCLQRLGEERTCQQVSLTMMFLFLA